MRRAKILFSFIFIFSSIIPSFGQGEIQDRIKEIEALLKDDIPSFKLKPQDIADGEKPELADSGWQITKPRFTLRNKVFWLRHEFQVPAVFSGANTEGTRVSLICNFRGLGKFKGKYFLNGTLKESFDLGFGNQAAQEKKEFLLSAKAQPGEKILLSFGKSEIKTMELVF